MRLHARDLRWQHRLHYGSLPLQDCSLRMLWFVDTLSLAIVIPRLIS